MCEEFTWRYITWNRFLDGVALIFIQKLIYCVCTRNDHKSILFSMLPLSVYVYNQIHWNGLSTAKWRSILLCQIQESPAIASILLPFFFSFVFTEAFATWITSEYSEHFAKCQLFMCISINMILLAFDASMMLKIAMVCKLFRCVCVCVCTSLWCAESFEIGYTVYRWIGDRISMGFQFAYALCVRCSFHVGILIKCLSLGVEWWWMVNRAKKKWCSNKFDQKLLFTFQWEVSVVKFNTNE